MAELAMTKRPAMHAGEMGLFVDSPVFEEDFGRVRTKVGLQVTVTQPHNLKQFRKAWVLAGKIADSGALGDLDKVDVMQYLLKKAKHVKYVYNKHRDGEELEVVVKSIRWAQLEQDAFDRIYNRIIFIVVSEILPDMREDELKTDVENMVAGPDQEPPPKQRRRRASPTERINPTTGEVTEIPATEPVTTSHSKSDSSAQPAADGPPPGAAGTVSEVPSPPTERKESSHEVDEVATPARTAAGSAARATPAKPTNSEEWVAYAYDWLATAKDDLGQTDQTIILRWNNERNLRNDCGVDSETRTPVFALFSGILDHKRGIK
jgi:hypothetical protein